MDIQDGNTMSYNDGVARPAQQKYSEYSLLQKLLEYDRKYAHDPALIKDQSSIGKTPLLEVLFSQCNGALIACAKRAVKEHEDTLNGWPALDYDHRHVLMTHSLKICTNRCIRHAATDMVRVSENYAMAREQFVHLGTVATCNSKIVPCFKLCEETYDAILVQWNRENPEP